MSSPQVVTPQSERDRAIEAVCLRMSYEAMGARSLAAVILAIAIAIALSFEVATSRLLWWLGFVLAVNGVRVAVWRALFSRPRTHDDLIRLRPWFSAAMAVCALPWASLIAFANFSHSLLVVPTVLLAIGGLIAGGLANGASTPREVHTSIFLSMTPILLHLLLSGETVLRAIMFSTTGFVFTMLAALKVNHREVRDSVALRFENQDLVRALTDEKKREREAREGAERANHEKSRFLAAASHDVRQPLHAMGLFVDTLKAQPLDAPARRLVDNIELAQASLVSLHEGLLEVSMLEGQRTSVRRRPVRLRELFAAIENEATPRAKEKRLGLAFRGPDVVVSTDPDLLLRLLRNLVSNALAYTEQGRVLVTARRSGGAVRVQVWDTGIGIPADQLDLIFEELHQVGNRARDRTRGLGLGLSIVKRIAVALGFEVKVRSTLGVGSEFSFTLPLETSAAPVDAVTPTVPVTSTAAAASETFVKAPAGSVALLVDDDGLARSALSSMLELLGYEVVAAQNAEEAQQFIAELERLDVVVSDHWLPGRAGLELLTDLKSSHPKVRRVLISGDTAPTTEASATTAGVAFIRKPVRSRALIDALS